MNTARKNDRQVHFLPQGKSKRNGVISHGESGQAVTRGRKNPLYQLVSQRLIELRGQADLAQAQLGELSGLSSRTICAVERAQVTSKISTIEMLASALGVSPVYLAFGEDGHLRWRERHPRFGIEPDPAPLPSPAYRPGQALHKGMGQRLRQAREAKGLSMRALGRVAGCTVSSISLLEAGTGIALLSTCEDLAKALDVAPGWLAFGLGAGPAHS